LIDKLEENIGLAVRLAVIVIVMLLATYLRFHLIDSQSLWYDEGNSARMILRSSREILSAAAADVHPPAYYLLLRVWAGMVGGSEFGLRSLSAFSGVVVVSGIYLIGYRLGKYLVGVLAGIIGAIHPGLVYYSQEVRMYMLCTLLGLILMYISMRLINFRKMNRFSSINFWHISFVICAAAGLYVHYSFGFILFAINLAFAYELVRISNKDRRSMLLEWISLQIGILILYMPWLSIAMDHLTSWPAERVHLPMAIAVWDVWTWLSLGPTIEAAETILGVVCLGTIVVIGLANERIVWITLWIITPAGLIIGFGLFSEAFSKFLVLAVPAVAIIAANGFACLIEDFKIPGRVLALFTIAVVFNYTYLSLDNLYHNEYYRRDDYRAIVADILDNYRDGDAVLLNAPNQAEVIEYYYPTMTHVFPVARTRPLDAGAQVLELEKIASEHSRLMGVFWGNEQSDPDDVVESWLNSNTFKTSESWYGQVRLMEYYVAEESRMEDINMVFGGIVRLERYGLNKQVFKPGDVIQVILDWSAVREISSRYKVFVHVYVDDNSPPLAQHDSEPVGGSIPTNTWTSNQVITDMHGVALPGDIGIGDYTLAIGMYSIDDGERLRVVGEQDGIDRLILSEISVVE